MKFNKPDVQVFLGRVVRPGTHRRRAAIATLLTLLAIPRMAGRRRFACAGGTSAIRFIEHVAPHVHPAPCHYMLGDPHQQATARWTHEGVVDQATCSGTGLG